MLVTEGSVVIFVQVIWLAIPVETDATSKLPVVSRIGVARSVVTNRKS